MMLKFLVVALAALGAMSGGICNPLATYVKGPLPSLADLEKSRSVCLTNETGKNLAHIEFDYSAQGWAGRRTLKPNEASGKPDSYFLTWLPPRGPVTIKRLAIDFGDSKITVVENERANVPGDLEIVLKPDLSIVYRTLEE